MMAKLELISQNCNFNYSTQIPSELILQIFMLGEYKEREKEGEVCLSHSELCFMNT